MKRIFRLSGILALFYFSHCFMILHYVGLGDDGLLEVNWRFTMSKALMDKGKQPGQEDLPSKIEKDQKDLESSLKGKVSNLKMSSISNDNDFGVTVQFKAKENLVLPGTEEFPFLPVVDKQKKTLVFRFKGDAKKKEEQPGKPDKKAKPSEDEPPNPEEAGEDPNGGSKEPKESKEDDMNKGFEELANAILSGARYQIILGGRFVPVKAVIKAKDGKELNLEIIPIGNQYLIDFPIMNLKSKESDGFDLIVTVK